MAGILNKITMGFHHVTKEVLAIAIVALVVVGILWMLYYLVTKGETPNPDEEIQRILGKEDYESTKH